MKGAQVGASCNLGEGAFVESGARLGDHVTVKNGVAIWDRVTLEDGVFVGPHVAFTNDRVPRSHPSVRSSPDGWESTRVRTGASIGANATLVCGIEVGEWAMVGAGAVVSRSVASHALVVGNPARRIGWVCACGGRLADDLACGECGTAHDETPGRVARARLRPAIPPTPGPLGRRRQPAPEC